MPTVARYGYFKPLPSTLILDEPQIINNT